MSVSVQDGPAILVGYVYRLQIELDAPLIEEGAAFTAHLRSSVSSAEVLAELTSANGGIARIGDHAIELTIGADLTAQLTPGSAVLDVARTDTPGPQHLGFMLEIPVTLPVTRI